MKNKYDIIIIGGGPGGYIAAIRAAQLGKKVAIIEKEGLGGICCNWGCIPTKSLLKNASVLDIIKNANKFGIEIPSYKVNWNKVILRSRNISNRLSKGIQYLLKKNKIDYFPAIGKIVNKHTVHCKSNDIDENLKTDYIILATGTIQKNIPGLDLDGSIIISSKEAMVLKEIPKVITIVGAGAIGIEFAHLFNTFGSKVNIVETLPNILPNEDEEISKELTAIFSKRKINILTGKTIKNIKKLKKSVKIEVGNINFKSDIVLVAVGVTGNINGLGLENTRIKQDKGFISINGFMQTSINNIYAIGDVSGPPLLAHVASAEGIIAVEHISGLEPKQMNYENIPSCTYCEPEVASIGLTETKAKEMGYKLKIGKFPFRALGKSLADGNHEGFVKIIYDEKYGELIGCHIIGHEASNLISEIGVARTLETTYNEVLKTIHPHPTLSEAINEATADALDEAIHI